jgi:hypothetical protein
MKLVHVSATREHQFFIMATLKFNFCCITLFYSTHKRDTLFVGKKTFVNFTNAVHISAPTNFC